ncbi:MAG: alpha/beta hydrolase [Deltaproteobacteria bacterium]|nr:MAG: alpha/beta hydrolase [Deltaproteobacteria bacterium]
MERFYSGEINGISFVAGGWPLAEDAPTLLFIHGSGGDHSLWSEQLKGLCGSFNVVALDLPGHGASSSPPSKSISEYAAKVAGFIRAAQLPMPVPCGLSIGGAIVLQLLLDYPEELFKAVLVSTGARLRVSPKIFDAIDKDYAAFARGILPLAAAPASAHEALASVVTVMEATPPKVTAGDFRACDAFDVTSRLGEINKPVLVLSALEDKLTPPKYGEFLKEKIPDAKLALIPEAGHLLPLEAPGPVNEALKDFLAAL